MSSVVEMIPMIQTLPAADQWAMLEQLVSILKGAGPLKVKPSKASKKAAKVDENGEPKEKRAVRPDSYIHLLHKVVSPALTAMAEATEDEAEKKQLKSVTARAQIAKALYETVKAITDEDKTVESHMRANAITEITKEAVADAFQSWKADPPAVEYVGKKAAKAAAAAAATPVITGDAAPITTVAPTVVAAPKVIKPKVVKPKVEKVAKPELSEEEKVAKKKAAAKAAYEKQKAKKAAEKAAAASAAPAAAPTAFVAATTVVAAPAVATVEEVSCDPYAWAHDFGTGSKTYERIDFDGVAYIYEADSKAYLGVYQETTNSLDLSIADPTAE